MGSTNKMFCFFFLIFFLNVSICCIASEEHGTLRNSWQRFELHEDDCDDLFCFKNKAIVEQFECDPVDILTPARFDVAAKYIYAKAREIGIKSAWPQEVYAAHLRVFNNFFEGWPRKTNLKDYLSSFNTILDSIKKNGYKNTNPIPVDLQGNICNGSHRLAASILYKVTIPVAVHADAQAPVISSEILKHARRYVKSGLDEQYLDAMALQYCELKRDTYIAIVFPGAIGKDNEIREILNTYGSVIYEKQVILKNNGPFNFIKQAYEGQEWSGTWNDNFAGVQRKIRACFPCNQKSAYPIRVFLISCDSLKKAQQAKKCIRSLFSLANHSIHITDTHCEAVRLARFLFMTNGIHFLNFCTPRHFIHFERYIERYKKIIQEQECDESCFCIDGSAVLAAYGLRDCADLDYLHHGDALPHEQYISSHNNELDYHAFSKDDLIFDPRNYFYYNGVKFASLDVVKTMKLKRNEHKDRQDITLIENLYKEASS